MKLDVGVNILRQPSTVLTLRELCRCWKQSNVLPGPEHLGASARVDRPPWRGRPTPHDTRAAVGRAPDRRGQHQPEAVVSRPVQQPPPYFCVP